MFEARVYRKDPSKKERMIYMSDVLYTWIERYGRVRHLSTWMYMYHVPCQVMGYLEYDNGIRSRSLQPLR